MAQTGGEGETLAGAQIGDFACGTGTLLSMAYQRMSLLHELHGGDSRKLHGPMMRHGLVGLDVLNIAVHLTAAMLAGSQPDTPFDGECLLTMPYGEQEDGNVAIGSLDPAGRDCTTVTNGHRRSGISWGQSAGKGWRDLVSRVGHTQFDLVIMNPPFVRSTGMEAEKRGTGNPAFAAFDTAKANPATYAGLARCPTRNDIDRYRATLASLRTFLTSRCARSVRTA